MYLAKKAAKKAPLKYDEATHKDIMHFLRETSSAEIPKPKKKKGNKAAAAAAADADPEAADADPEAIPKDEL